MSDSLQAVAPGKPALNLAASRPSGWDRQAVLDRGRAWARGLAVRLLPPLVMIVVLLAVWQLLASHPTSTLPPPTKVLTDSWELVADPFFDRGGLDKGLFWHLVASLRRVALGFSFAAVVGVAFGVLIGQSPMFLRALDPIFQVLRTVPPLAWLPLALAAFRDGQPSAIFVIFITSVWPILINTSVGVRNIPEDFRNIARVIRLSPLEYF